MATVYLARQPDLERLVALKELAAFGSQHPQMVARFLREAQIAGSLSDPNIVTVYESFIVDGMPHISMEYLRRGSLRPIADSLQLDQAIMVIHDMLSGLTAAEKQHIVHRDLKPENVLITDDRHVKIADFGIAKAVDRVGTQEFKTATGMTVGTPAYMAPEQAMGREITPATDLYSVGVMAFEMMTGRLSFEADSPVALLMRHVSDEPPSPLSVKADLDPALSAWILRLLVKDPAERTQTAEQAWEELEDLTISLLGARWRREARLPHVEEPPDEYFTVQPERVGPQPPTTSSAWGLPESGPYTPPPVPGPYTPPPGALQEPLPTPLPEDMPTRMPTPRSGPGQYTPPPEAPPAATPP